MRIVQRLTILLFAMITVVFIGAKAYIYLKVDSTPPVISCDTDILDVRVGAPESQLLEGITAIDDVDGDLTSQIIVQSVSQLITGNTGKVTYIVFDSSNNMATAQRTVRYLNYEKPRITLSQPLVFKVGSNIRLLPYLSAQDDFDGNISRNIRIINQNVDSSNPGVYNVTLEVVNRKGDAESVPVKVVVQEELLSTNPLTLSEYIAYVDVDSDFTPYSYIVSPVNKNDVVVDSQVDTAKPGAYDVTYTYENYTVYQTVVVR